MAVPCQQKIWEIPVGLILLEEEWCLGPRELTRLLTAWPEVLSYLQDLGQKTFPSPIPHDSLQLLCWMPKTKIFPGLKSPTLISFTSPQGVKNIWARRELARLNEVLSYLQDLGQKTFHSPIPHDSLQLLCWLPKVKIFPGLNLRRAQPCDLVSQVLKG